MAENPRPPVAIRIVRPYDNEDELLAHELETIGKTSVVLIGAHPRPTGVILRFEVTLASGATVLRGEGRVLAHKENAFRGQSGLTLRFTRLDPRSKALVDRATAMREARSQGEPVPSSRPLPPQVEGALADALTASTPRPAQAAPKAPAGDPASTNANRKADQETAVANARANAREKANATARANAKRTGSRRPMALTPPPVPVVPVVADVPVVTDVPVVPVVADVPVVPVVHAEPTPGPTPVTSEPGNVEEAPTYVETRATVAGDFSAEPPQPAPMPAPAPPPLAEAKRAEPSPGALEPPPDRAELLARLRERACKLAPERVEEILAARR